MAKKKKEAGENPWSAAAQTAESAHREIAKCLFYRSSKVEPVCERTFDRLPDFDQEMGKIFGGLALKDGERCFMCVYLDGGEPQQGRKPKTQMPVSKIYWIGPS